MNMKIKIQKTDDNGFCYQSSTPLSTMSITVAGYVLEENDFILLDREEAIAYYADKIKGISVTPVLKKLLKTFKNIAFSSNSVFFVNTMEDKVYSYGNTEADEEKFMSIVHSLINYESNEFNYLTLVDREESINRNEEFIYCQIPTPNGYISEEDLCREVYELYLENVENGEHFTLKEIQVKGAYPILLEQFTLKKDKRKLEASEY